LGKPFDLDEVAARLRALHRRGGGHHGPLLKWCGLVLNPATQTLEQGGRPVHLSRREYAVLHALMVHPGQILSRRQIEEKLYGWQEEVESNAVEVHIHHLRNKLGLDVRGGSVCLNSFWRFVKWITASIMPSPTFASARCSGADRGGGRS